MEALHYRLLDKPHESKTAGPLSCSVRYGLPECGPNVYAYENYAVRYDHAKKVPIWAMQRLTKENLAGSASRANSQFQIDDRVNELFHSSNDDYWDSGWARGHMVPAGDNKHSQKAMDDTFYLTNVAPQDMCNNESFWNRLERYCRHLATEKYDLEIVSGPLWLPSTGKDGKRSVSYDVIGKNDVAVPTHLFKVIAGETTGSENSYPVLAAFVVPNVNISDDKQPIDYEVPVESVERSVGVQFFPRLDRRNARNLCEVDGCRLVDSPEVELFLLQRRIRASYSLEKLEKTWMEVRKKDLASNKDLRDAYDKKREQLGK